MSNPSSTPLVMIVLGSDSDLPVMSKCLDILDRFKVPYQAAVCSAHRTPDDCAELAKTAAGRGIRVVIAAAGGAAHLGGVIAAHTILPVIAVPIASTPLAGFDSLLSMVQMPPGIPVATVAVGEFGAVNAGILAVQILALGDAKLAERLHQHKAEMVTKVHEKNDQMAATLRARTTRVG
jgi:phosphoribosylaminoimidazole carboxylase PurE protein